MTVFSTLKHSTICLFSLTIGWVYPVCAETLEIIKTYDQTNKKHEVEAVIQFKVIDDKNRLKLIEKNNITITSNGEPVEKFRLIKPEDSSPDPSRIIILLDMSGSMKWKDSSGQVRGLAALQAIRSFIDYLKINNYPSEVAVVPFATDGPKCGGGYVPPPVDNNALSKFYSPSSETLNTEISNLENTFNPDNRNLPCGGTDIRNPVKNAVEYLKTNYPLPSDSLDEESTEEPIRLGIILLSDGFDRVLSDSKLQEDKELSQLETFLKNNKNDITLHTLGYGEEGSIDIEVLQRLASASGGVNLFSANARQINEALKEFLVSLVGKYEIHYKPTSIKQYELEKAEITVAGLSEAKEFRIQNIPSLPLSTRIFILTGTLVFSGIFGLLPFLGWRWWIEREAG